MTSAQVPEKIVAAGSILAPIAVPLIAPSLQPDAAFAATLAVGGYLALSATAYTERISKRLMGYIPGSDILHSHRSTLMLSSSMTTVGMAVGTLGDWADVDALLAGLLAIPDLVAVPSLLWWGAWALLPFKLRHVLKRRRGVVAPAAAPQQTRQITSMAERILARWAKYASPQTGTAPGHVLSWVSCGREGWQAIATAPRGQQARVKRETISALYEVELDRVEVIPGNHSGQVVVRVYAMSRERTTQVTPTDIKSLWLRKVGREGGALPGSEVTQIEERDGIKGLIIKATEDCDALEFPDLRRLAGALRSRIELISYEPTGDPRTAKMLVMESNPLQNKRPLTDPTTILLKHGAMRLGRMASGRPAMVKLIDKALGAMHVAVLGSTGSGKGGVIQLIALSAHLSGSSIIYADPKGSSNPTVEKMAAYSGTGKDGSLRALRIAYAILQERIAQSAKTGEKNFTPRPDRPHILTIIDEAPEVIGEGHTEGSEIAEAISRLGRSVGMSLLVASQTFKAEAVGSTTTREQIVVGGTLVVLRVSKDASRLMDLPASWAGVDPSHIPASWSNDDDGKLFYEDTEEIPPADRTYGLGYLASGDSSAPAMFRAEDLEDATDHVAGTTPTLPADMPWWHDEPTMTAIEDQRAPTKPSAQKTSEDTDDDSGGGPLFANDTAKPTTQKEKAVTALHELYSLLGDPDQAGFETKEIAQQMNTTVTDSLRTTLNKLAAENTIRKVGRGIFALPDEDN